MISITAHERVCLAFLQLHLIYFLRSPLNSRSLDNNHTTKSTQSHYKPIIVYVRAIQRVVNQKSYEMKLKLEKVQRGVIDGGKIFSFVSKSLERAREIRNQRQHNANELWASRSESGN